MKKKFFRKKDYNFKQHRLLRASLILLLFASVSILAFFSQKPNDSFADTKSECKKGQDIYVQQACDVWYSQHDDWTSMTYEWISNDSGCSHDAVTIKSSESGQVGKYLCSMAFTGNNDDRANATYKTTEIDTGSPYFSADGQTLVTQANGSNSWSSAASVGITVDADALKKSVGENIIGSETICTKQTMTSNLEISTGGGGHKTPSGSPLCLEVENQPVPPKIINNEPEPEPIVSTETSRYQEIYYAAHEFGPIKYGLTMGIEKLDYNLSTPKYTGLSLAVGNEVIKTTEFRKEEDPAIFYTSEEDPIATESIAEVNALSGITTAQLNTLENLIKNDLKICGKSNIEDATQMASHSWIIFNKFLENFRFLIENSEEVEDTSSYEDADDNVKKDFITNSLKKLVKYTSLFLQAAAYTAADKDVQKEFGKFSNAFLNAAKCNAVIVGDTIISDDQISNDIMKNKPTPSISEGIVYLNPGETRPITSYAFIPSTKIKYTIYIKYTKTYTTTTEYTDGVLSDEYKTLTDMTSEIIGYEKTYDTNSEDRVKSDTRYIRRLGNIYGTSFTTRLKSVNKGTTYTGDPGIENPADFPIEATAKKEGETDNDNPATDSASYEGKIFAGSDNEDYLVATYQHAASAKADNDTTEEGCKTMSEYNIPWYIDGTARNSGDGNLETISFNLSSGKDCMTTKDPLGVSGSDTDNKGQYWTSTEKISNSEIPLGTYERDYIQKGHMASKYELQSDKTLKESDNKLEAEVSFKVYRPWNYKLSILSVTNSPADPGPGYLLAGEGGATITVEVKNEANNSAAGQEGNPSYSPDDTKIELFRITVGSKDDLNDKNDQLTQRNQDIGGEPITTMTSNSDNPKGRINYANGNTPGSKEVKFEDSKASSSGEVGSHVCYFARINHKDSVADTSGHDGYGTPSENYVYSGLTCFTLIGFPTAQIWGGNVFSAGKIHTRVYEGIGYALGSWADYGIIGKGEVIGLASGKTLPKAKAAGDSSTSPIYNCQNHPLTINNSSTSGGDCYYDSTSGSIKNLGSSQIAASRTLTKLKNIYSSKTGGGTKKSASYLGGITYSCYDSSSYASGVPCNNDESKNRFRYTYYDGDLKLSDNDDDGGKLPIGVTHVIYATGNIDINTDLTYAEPTSGYGSLNQIPQYIIIAEKDIKIGKEVENVNAWLIARGELDTCKDAKEITKTDYDSKTCSQSLTINGPVFANKIMLRRTAGSTQNEFTTPAEKFDLTPLSYYWAFYQASQTGRASTVYTRNLPPRL